MQDGHQPQAVLDYVAAKGWSAKKHGSGIISPSGEVVLRECPYCEDNRFKFSISLKHDGHPFQCWVCEKKGNLQTLKRDMGDEEKKIPKGKYTITQAIPSGDGPKKNFDFSFAEEAHKRLMKNEHNSLEELKNRGLTEETIRHFMVGVTEEMNGSPTRTPVWSFPYFHDVDGETKVGLVKYRSVPPAEKRMFREKDMDSLLYNRNHIPESADSIIVCEGEIDAMSIWQSGHRNVISVSAGAKSFKSEWIDYLDPFDRITLLFDSDDAGRKGAREIAQRLGAERVSIITLPEGQDANDILANKGIEVLSEHITKAENVPIDGVEHISDTLEDLQAAALMGEQIYGGLKWMFPDLTDAVGEVEPGQLWVVTGQAGVGKTTLLKQQFKEWAIEGNPCLIWCGEMTQKQLVRQLIQSEYGVQKADITPDHIGQTYRKFREIPLFFGYHGADPSAELLTNMATQAFKRFGIKHIIIDNLALITGGAKNSSDELLVQSRAVRAFKNWCIQFGANVFLVAHPRKAQDVNHIETAYDVSGSANIRNLADAGLTLFRKNLAPRNADDLYQTRTELLDRKTAIIPLKTRESSGNTDAWLYLEGEYSRFRECTEEDWNDDSGYNQQNEIVEDARQWR